MHADNDQDSDFKSVKAFKFREVANQEELLSGNIGYCALYSEDGCFDHYF